MNFPKLRPGWKWPLHRLFSSRFLWVAIALAFALLVGLTYYQPYYFTYDDNATGYLPQQVYNYRCVVEHGTLPLLNFHQFLGEAYYVMGTPGVLYLPNYLCTFFADKVLGDIMACVQVSVCLHLFLAALAAYAYLRIVKVSGLVSCYGALLYLTLPFLLCASKSWLVIAVCAFYIPALLACLEAFLLTRSSIYLVIQCALKISFIYHGNIQFVMIYGLGELIYLGNRWPQLSRRPDGRMILSYLLSNLVVIAAALPLVIPMQAALAESAKRAEPMPVLTQICNAVLPKYWLRAQLYLFLPRMVSDSSDSILFLGGCIFFLVCLYACRSRLSQRWQSLWHLLLIALLLSTVANVVLRVIPYFDRIRWPFKWYVYVTFCYAALTAIFLDEVMRRRLLARVWIHGFYILAIICNLLVTISPISQVAFGPYHITPQIAKTPLEPLGEGRFLVYGIAAVDSYQALMEIRPFGLATLYEDSSFSGYNPLVLKKVKDATLELNFTTVLYRAAITTQMRDVLNQWNVRYIIAPINPRDERIRSLEALPDIVFLRTTPSGFRIYENRQSRPYAWAENNPTRALPLRFGINSAELTLNGAHGNIVLSLIRIPGWNYRIDDGPWQPVQTETLYGQITIPVPHDSQRLTLSYTPLALHKSLLGSALFLAILLPVWWFATNRSWSAWRVPFPKLFYRPTAPIQHVELGRITRSLLLITAVIWILITIVYAMTIDRSVPALDQRPATPMEMYWELR